MDEKQEGGNMDEKKEVGLIFQKIPLIMKDLGSRFPAWYVCQLGLGIHVTPATSCS